MVTKSKQADLELPDTDVEVLPSSNLPTVQGMVSNGNSTALVAYEETSTPMQVQITNDIEKLQGEHVMFPLLRLAQSPTASVQDGVDKLGDWLLAGFPTLKDVTLIPLAIGMDRIYRPKDNPMTVSCRSTDTILGVGNPGGLCEKCPMAQWVDGKKPPCSLRYNYIAYCVEHGMPVRLILASSATKVAKQINGMVLGQGGFAKFAVRLTSQVIGQPRYALPVINYAHVSEDVMARAASLVPQSKAIDMMLESEDAN